MTHVMYQIYSLLFMLVVYGMCTLIRVSFVFRQYICI